MVSMSSVLSRSRMNAFSCESVTCTSSASESDRSLSSAAAAAAAAAAAFPAAFFFLGAGDDLPFLAGASSNSESDPEFSSSSSDELGISSTSFSSSFFFLVVFFAVVAFVFLLDTFFSGLGLDLRRFFALFFFGGSLVAAREGRSRKSSSRAQSMSLVMAASPKACFPRGTARASRHSRTRLRSNLAHFSSSLARHWARSPAGYCRPENASRLPFTCAALGTLPKASMCKHFSTGEFGLSFLILVLIASISAKQAPLPATTSVAVALAPATFILSTDFLFRPN
mmetsp:Transcript_30607/g.44991  ORF Transcript_30607/g.44991 Transcript_30607/m.44991 type:complete len:283 (-) Transcript_30607:404-1252(-)